jgi:ferric-dicitrate binding protein FerR (iron transport regulator)
MSVEPIRLQYLLQQYANNECTGNELLELMQVIEEVQHDETLHTSLLNVWQNISASDALPAIDKEKIFNNIITASPVPVLPQKRRIWLKAAAAAVLIGSAAWIMYAYLHAEKKQVEKTVVAKNNLKNDVAPGGNRAILTLSNGSTIVLDSAHNGALATQGNTSVSKVSNGQLEYQSSIPDKSGQAGNRQSAIIGSNTLQTPRGGQYQVVLPDGTKVWLNAASSLKYPTAFSERERRVELTGEAYFEVAHLTAGNGFKKVPFIVSVLKSGGEKAGEVEVLGTHFNINAYEDENAIQTTLLQGSVKVGSRQWAVGSGGKAEGRGQRAEKEQSVILKPGEQAILSQSSQTIPVQTVQTDGVIAWKNGLFDFRSAEIHTVMRQLSRWYDIEVTYSKPVLDKFYAKIPRNTRLSDVLQALMMTGSVHFKIEGKTVTVF